MPYIANTPTINANIFFTSENNSYGTVGIAWVGTVCFTNTSFRASVNEYFYTDLQTAWVNISKLLEYAKKRSPAFKSSSSTALKKMHFRRIKS